MSFWARLRQRNARQLAPQAREPVVDSWISAADGAAQSLHTFGLTLLQQEVSQTPKQNVFLSPLSVFSCVGDDRNGCGRRNQSSDAAGPDRARRCESGRGECIRSSADDKVA